QREDKRFDQYEYQALDGYLAATQLLPGNESSDPFSSDKFTPAPIIDGDGSLLHSVVRYYYEGGSPLDHSFGYSEVKAVFAMADYAVTPLLRLSGGLRIEQAYIYTDIFQFDSLNYALDDSRRNIPDYGIFKPGKLDKASYLPSINVIYKLKNDKEDEKTGI